MAYTMSTGTPTTPPPFTPPPACVESLSHLYRATTQLYTPTCITCSAPTGAAQVCTSVSNSRGAQCAYYNLGYEHYYRYDRDTCAPEGGLTSTPYSGCPVGYTTACAGSSSSTSMNLYLWPSTEIRAICCPTHSLYTFTCAGWPSFGETPSSTPSSSSSYDHYAWASGLNPSSNGCVAPVTAAASSAPDAAVTVDVLSVSTWYVTLTQSAWTNSRGATTRRGTSFQTEVSTATSTATLTPGVDFVSAEPVGLTMTVWGKSTCFPGGRSCETPAPMWGGRGLYGLSLSRPTLPPWPVTPKYGSTGVVSVVLLCFVSLGFFFSVLGFWRKGRRMSERREDIRIQLLRARRSDARQRNYHEYYGQ